MIDGFLLGSTNGHALASVRDPAVQQSDTEGWIPVDGMHVRVCVCALCAGGWVDVAA
jgi:hypothetical protein